MTHNFEVIHGALQVLARLEGRTQGLEETAYGWCIRIWENRSSYEDWKALLLLSLEAGFRHLHSQFCSTLIQFPAKFHQGVFDTVLKGNNIEAIADLALASFGIDEPGRLWLRVWDSYITSLHSEAPFPRVLKQNFIVCAMRGSRALIPGEREEFVKLVNRLHIGLEDLWSSWNIIGWGTVLLETIRWATDLRLAIHSWELLTELTFRGCFNDTKHLPDIATSLVDEEEWDELKCWMRVVWMGWSQKPDDTAKGLERAMRLLEEKRPSVLQLWMEEWREKYGRDVPGWFQKNYSLAL